MRRVVLLRTSHALVFALRSSHAMVILMRGEQQAVPAPAKFEVV